MSEGIFIMSEKFVIYRRLSVEDRSRKQHGFESQMRDIEDYLAKQDSPEVIGSFHEFVSGAESNKPKLKEAIELCKETGATLLIAKLDRLSRKVSQISVLMESDITLRVALMPNASTFELHIYASLAEQEREMIRDRVKRGLAVVKSESPEKLRKTKGTAWHKSYTANKAAGLHNTTKQFKPSPEKDKLLVDIKTAIKYSNPKSFVELAEKLNTNNVVTLKGKAWCGRTLSTFAKRNNISI